MAFNWTAVNIVTANLVRKAFEKKAKTEKTENQEQEKTPKT